MIYLIIKKTDMCLCVYGCVYVYNFMYIYDCVYVDLYVYIDNIYIYIYIYIYICTYVCVYVYIYIFRDYICRDCNLFGCFVNVSLYCVEA